MTSATRTQEPSILTIEEAAAYLRLSRTKVYELVASGELPSIRVGRSVRIDRLRLEAWVGERSR